MEKPKYNPLAMSSLVNSKKYGNEMKKYIKKYNEIKKE